MEKMTLSTACSSPKMQDRGRESASWLVMILGFGTRKRSVWQLAVVQKNHKITGSDTSPTKSTAHLPNGMELNREMRGDVRLVSEGEQPISDKIGCLLSGSPSGVGLSSLGFISYVLGIVNHIRP